MEETYRLDVEVEGNWQTLCRVTAADPWEAYTAILPMLAPHPFPRPIRIEPERRMTPTPVTGSVAAA